MKVLLIIGCVVAVMTCAVVQAEVTETDEGIVASSAVTCQKGDLSRTVEVTYAGAQGEPPCEVHYRKMVEAPGHDEVLWNSAHTRGYCESRMQAFVEKLEGMGWACR